MYRVLMPLFVQDGTDVKFDVESELAGSFMMDYFSCGFCCRSPLQNAGETFSGTSV
jgi:hypothetical protein